jgi:DHA2 family multidrug resistance protein-like MFS transporter
MSIAAVLAIIFGLKEVAQNGVGPMPIGAVLLGLVIGVAWVRRQQRLADPMIDVNLFRIRSFNASLAVNFLSIFVMVGYFLFVAQYLQLVVGLSPLEAGLWSLPSAAAFIVGSQLAPRIVRRVRPGYLIGGGLAIGAVGLGMLTQVGTVDGLGLLIAASVVTSIGLAPVFGLTTELIVGSAPPERAGAASGISETAAELGGALGIAILGSVGVAIYRAEMAAGLPSSVPADAAATALDTLGGAVAVASQLPGELGATVLQLAQEAFVAGMHLTSGIATVIAFGLAILAVVALRNQRLGGGEDTEANGAPATPSEQVAQIAPRELEGAS